MKLFAIAMTSVAFFAASHDARANSCFPGQKTQIAGSCANAFSKGSGSFYPWDDSKMQGMMGRTVLNTNACRSGILVDVRPDSHMALYRCEGQEYWVNLDSLKCSSSNIEDRAPQNPWDECIPCKRMGNAQLLGRAGEIIRDHRKVYGKIVDKLLTRAMERAGQVQSVIDRDTLALSDYYNSKTPAERDQLIARSASRLASLAKSAQVRFGPRCDQNFSNLPDEAAVRGQRACLLFVQAAAYAKDHVQNNWVSGGLSNPIFQSPLVASVQHAQNTALFGGGPRDYSDLVSRTVLFYGLTAMEQRAWVAEKKISFVRSSAELADNGLTPLELHNGYVYGGYRVREGAGPSGYDCSDFVSSLIRGERSAVAPTALSFMEVAQFLDHERKVVKPEERRLAACFDSVDLRNGELPQPADIVVSKTMDNDLHVVLVKSFDSDTGSVTTLEATGGRRNSVGEFSRPIYEPSCSSDQSLGALRTRPVRADIKVLRFRADPGSGCPLRLNGD